MRFFVCLITACWIGLPGFAQTQIQVILVTNRPIGRVVAFDIDKREILSVPYADTIAFSFKNKVINCYDIGFQEGDKYYQNQIWVNPGHVTIMAHLAGEGLCIDSVLNDPIYDTVQKIVHTIDRLTAAKDTNALNDFLLKAYASNIDNPFSYFPGMCYLLANEDSKPDLLKLKALRDRQGKRFEWFPFYQDFINDLENRLDPNRLPKDSYLVMDRNKNTYPLQYTLDKKWRVLNFWSLGDAACLEEQNTIKTLQEQLAANSIGIIGISIDPVSQFDTWKTYLFENGYGWTNFLQTGRGKLSDRYGIHKFPAYVILNEDGDVQQTVYRFSEVLKALGVNKP